MASGERLLRWEVERFRQRGEEKGENIICLRTERFKVLEVVCDE